MMKRRRKWQMIKITVKCVCCDYTKEVGDEQTEMPMCDKCFSPMVATKAEAKTSEDAG